MMPERIARPLKEGILISFEGIDASGKDTQSRLLREKLASLGYQVELLSFPDYSTQIGKEIESFLRRERSYGAETRHVLYAANRYEHREQITNWLQSEGKIVIANRYSDSNVAYGVASGLPLDWVRALEERMPKPNYTFLLKIAPKVSFQRLIGKRKRDLFEEDTSFLERVAKVYDALVEEGRWFVVDADRPIEVVHYEVSRLSEMLIAEHRFKERGDNSGFGKQAPH